MTPDFKFREDTWDSGIFYDVFVRNEYQLPESFKSDDIIIDVGLHIGSFTAACLEKGCGLVIAFEPYKPNFKLAEENLCAYGPRVRLYNEGLWSKSHKDPLKFKFNDNKMNTGGGQLSTDGQGEEITTKSLDEVLEPLEKVRLLKLDCEGAEFPILLNASLFNKVEEICGEYHNWGGKINDLATYLKGFGFKTRILPNPNDKTIGLFWCSR